MTTQDFLARWQHFIPHERLREFEIDVERVAVHVQLCEAKEWNERFERLIDEHFCTRAEV